MRAIKNFRVLVVVATLVIIAVILLSLVKIFQATPPKAPEPSMALSKPRTIGVLFVRQSADALEGIKMGLKELGYTNITFKEILMDSQTTIEDVENLTKKLVGEKVDLIYATGESRAQGAINATKEIGDDTPIVYLSNFHDPVAYGLAKSFISSGNNATGVARNIAKELERQLELLQKIKPGIKKIGVFGRGFVVQELGGEFLSELKGRAPKFGYEVIEYTTSVTPPNTGVAFDTAAATIKPGDIDALYHIAGHFYSTQEVAETALAVRLQIPMVAPLEDLPNGGHFGYSGDFSIAGKQVAKMADKIFRGANPRDIPLEYVEETLLVIYPVRARLAGVEFPGSVLEIADNIVNDR